MGKDISVDADLSGGLNLGLGNIRVRELANVDVNLGLDGGVGITELPPIQVGITELPPIQASADLAITQLPTVDVDLDLCVRVKELPTIRLESDSKVDLGLDDIRITELPQIDFQLGLRPSRFHFPLNYQLGFSLCGFQLWRFDLCGEGMVVAEDYQARATEKCK